MMRLNVGLKSTLLALAVIVAAPATMRAEVALPLLSSAVERLGTIQPVTTAALVTGFALWVRLQTKSDKEQFKTSAADDYKKLWESFDLLDTEFYQHLVMLFDKYVVGQKIKFVQKDIPQEDGSTIKGKKTLSQEARGAFGLFDAYVLSQVKSFGEQLPALASLYLLLCHFDLAAKNSVNKAAEVKSIT